MTADPPPFRGEGGRAATRPEILAHDFPTGRLGGERSVGKITGRLYRSTWSFVEEPWLMAIG
jgi:hypothetical protein